MRICHVTYDHRINYGSCFQAFALDSVLRRMGHDVSLSYSRSYRSALSAHRGMKKKLGMLASRMIYDFRFRQFQQKYVRYTRCLTGNRNESLGKLDSEYDTFVTGSDIVWNTDNHFGSDIYYLGFTEKYKFSYAASFGKGVLNAEDERQARQYLPELDAISVREKSSAENAARFTDKPVEIVVDPVLLLEKEKWLSLAEKQKETKPYIFVYTTYLTDSVLAFLKKLQEQTGLQTVWSAASIKDMLKLRQFHYYSPEEWLGLLSGAEYVVTNSFHATAFSTILHKKFFSFVPKDGRKGIGSRLYDFLEQFGLESRIYIDCPTEIDTTAPDFTLADEKIPLLRERSMDFLRRNLEAAEQRLKESEIKH